MSGLSQECTYKLMCLSTTFTAIPIDTKYNPNYHYKWLEHQAKMERHGLLEDQRLIDILND
jgi:hypothetical protein